MQIALTLVGPNTDLVTAALGEINPGLAALGARVKASRHLGPGATDLLLEGGEVGALRRWAAETLGDRPIDLCIQPWEGRRKGLLIADMDSTIIGCECLDELADFAGVKDQVSAITERAMRGELDFDAALRERVAMLRGLSIDALQAAYDERVRLNPGARTLVRTMAHHGARCMLVSGGFTFFTERVAAAAGFHGHRSNTLITQGDKLTGAVADPILGRQAKLDALLGETAALNLDPARNMALGDGANDLAMIEAAGLGLAYRAKPIVAAQADAKLDHTDLTAALYFQGYRVEEFVED
ncbi:MAG: phosphoserine phosphatase SerB [Phenylobacterium zucineum]|nr:MAG: phosphoserine phosphatase SerB [Phenylobacterium zucineum]